MKNIVREIDTEEWKMRVQQDAIRSLTGSGVLNSYPIEVCAPPGFDLDIGVKIRTITEARRDTGLARESLNIR